MEKTGFQNKAFNVQYSLSARAETIKSKKGNGLCFRM